MKITKYTACLINKVKKAFVPKNRYFPDGRPLQIYKDGLLTKYNYKGEVILRKTEHECLQYGYAPDGKVIKESYTSTPKFFFRGSHTLLWDEFVKK